MPLGTEVGLGPGDIVLDGDLALPKKEHSTSTFRPMSIVAKRSPISATAGQLYKRSPKKSVVLVLRNAINRKTSCTVQLQRSQCSATGATDDQSLIDS